MNISFESNESIFHPVILNILDNFDLFFACMLERSKLETVIEILNTSTLISFGV